MSPTVLLIDDDEIIRRQLYETMKREGWSVFAAEDGDQGMKLFAEVRVDIVLADIKMSKKDGLAVLQEVKASGRDCEVILMSGYGDESIAIDALRKGAIDFIQKPPDLNHTIVSIEKAFEKLQLIRANRYKARELELAGQIVATITGQGLSGRRRPSLSTGTVFSMQCQSD